jgi:ketosteroid isomerase-like protein
MAGETKRITPLLIEEAYNRGRRPRARGRAVDGPGFFLYRFASGRIAESWANWDTIGVMQQLGIIPPQLGSESNRVSSAQARNRRW